MKTHLALVLVLAATSAGAESRLPFGRDWVGDRELPPPFGVGVDLFTMQQDYDLQRLAFTLPGVSLADPSVIAVETEIEHEDLKFDVWLLPFLNVFGIYGHISGDTRVDLSRVPSQLPIPLGTLPVKYGGQVYGGGFTLAYGGEHWFASLTGTYADTDLKGDFDSSVESTTWQPRIGYVNGGWQYWIGGFYLDADEKHSGNFVFPGLGVIPFEVELTEKDSFNLTAGVHTMLGDHVEISLELGGGDRTTTLLNLGWRF